jgi:predicted DsbA family dithiol-disulfide isomerase
VSEDSAGPFKILAISDYVCPWCYIGLKRIQQLEKEFEIEVEWQPYELHPEIPPEGMPLQGLFGDTARAAAYFDNLRAYAAEAGIDLKRPAIITNSRQALEAAEFAREHDRFDAYHPALFRAYFEEGRDIGDPDVLCDLASECGLDAAALREALRSQRYASLVERQMEEARQRGMSGTPNFLFDGRFTLVGAQEYRVFQDLAERMGARRRR